MGNSLFDEHGNFLGRSLESWLKITGFYLVYYTFLGILFYGFTISYYQDSRVFGSNPVGGKPAVAYPRLDMPGAAVHPFKELQQDGAVSRFNLNKKTTDNDISIEEYCAPFADYFGKKEKLNENSVDCSTTSTTDGTCNLNLNVHAGPVELEEKKLGANACKILTEDQRKPMFAIDINKIIGWEPSNAGIHFQCYEYDEKSAKKLEKQPFDFKFISESSYISKQYYPFNGVSSEQLVELPIDAQRIGKLTEDCNTSECASNKPYNKPFVAGFIDGDFKKNKNYMFRCDILSDKISRQFKETSEEAKANNADLRKLGIGFVEFGYTFKF